MSLAPISRYEPMNTDHEQTQLAAALCLLLWPALVALAVTLTVIK